MINVTFEAISESDFEHFKTLRKSVMREHVDQQGLPWIEEAENKYHRELFDTPGLRKIKLDKKTIGYVGVRYDGEAIEIGRLCIEASYQGKGIGTRVLEQIFAEPQLIGQKMKGLY